MAERKNFYPLALSRPIWELRCGMTSLGEKLVARTAARDVACFVPPYLAEVYRHETAWPVNDLRSLRDDDLLVVDARVKAAALDLPPTGPSVAIRSADGQVLVARIHRADLPNLSADSIESLLDAAAKRLPAAEGRTLPTWNYTWDLILANPGQLVEDFRRAGRRGIEGTIEPPSAIRGSPADVYVAPGARVHPMVVLDAEHGPIYIDRDAEIHPFTRIEGPCYVGRGSILLGAKCREGNSIGPFCRVGGEIEESILQGYSNKYHDGFLGHAYVGQWVNLGALTSNSDLKNDYSNVSVLLDLHTPIDTGSAKVGAMIGDHAKTAIGTLLNTGANVGGMTLLVGGSRLLPKYIPSFTWYFNDAIVPGMGKARAYSTARTVLARRQQTWTEADEALWDAVYEMTSVDREEALGRSGKK
jgi:UDP-N-acetylglucosamine diphosphorylase/glucosamine-1-phosphate N-acetyltransferase